MKHEVPAGRRLRLTRVKPVSAFCVRRNQNHLRPYQGLRRIALDRGPGAKAAGLYACVALRLTSVVCTHIEAEDFEHDPLT